MKTVSLLAVLAMLVSPLALQAQEPEEQGPLTSVWIIVPKADMEEQFEAAVADYMKWRVDAGDSREWHVYSPVIGHNLNVYQFRACCFAWADQDAYNAEGMKNGYGEEWNAKVDEYVDHYHRYMEHVDWENSHWEDSAATEGPYFGVTTWTRKLGVGGDPEMARKEISQMALKEGWGEAGYNWLWLSREGGTPTIMLVNPYSDYADMQEPEPSFFEFVADKMGGPEKADALFTRFGSGLATADYTVWRHRETLSMPDRDD